MMGHPAADDLRAERVAPLGTAVVRGFIEAQWSHPVLFLHLAQVANDTGGIYVERQKRSVRRNDQTLRSIHFEREGYYTERVVFVMVCVIAHAARAFGDAPRNFHFFDDGTLASYGAAHAIFEQRFRVRLHP